MIGYMIRRVPWTCRWGRFAVAIEDLGSTSRVDDAFWACHNPVRGPDVRVTKRVECESCPFWEMARDCTPRRTVGGLCTQGGISEPVAQKPVPFTRPPQIRGERMGQDLAR